MRATQVTLVALANDSREDAEIAEDKLYSAISASSRGSFRSCRTRLGGPPSRTMTVGLELPQRHLDRGHRVQRGGVEGGDAGVLGPDEDRDLGAAEHDAFGAARHEAVEDLAMHRPRAVEEAAAAEFFDDDALDLGALVLAGDQDLDAEPFAQAVDEDAAALHREAGADEAHAADSLLPDRRAQGIGDMQQRYAGRAFDLAGHQMHGVAADHQEIGAAACQHRADLRHGCGRVVPAPGILHRRDLAEVEGIHQRLGRMHAAEALLNLAIDELIIDGRGYPAHPAEHADGFHAPTLEREQAFQQCGAFGICNAVDA